MESSEHLRDEYSASRMPSSAITARCAAAGLHGQSEKSNADRSSTTGATDNSQDERGAGRSGIARPAQMATLRKIQLAQQVQRKRENHARARDPKFHEEDGGGQQRHRKTGARGHLRPDRPSPAGAFKNRIANAKTNAQIEGENHPVLAAAEQTSNAELHDRGLQ